ncbi:MAG: SpoIVB peptidase [Clostridia bacterium]|nr:SpoIVB peptidase [Clostridia bacterium]
MNRKLLSAPVRILGVALSLAVAVFNYLPSMRALRELPAVIRVTDGANGAEAALDRAASRWIYFSEASVAVSAQDAERLGEVADYSRTFLLFGRIPVKTVQVLHSEDVHLAAGGQAVGITIRTDGVLVVGLGAVDTRDGALSPGAAAGLRAGDVILRANGKAVADSAHLSAICEGSDGLLTLSVQRGGETLELDVQLVQDLQSAAWRLGLWVRDSTAGVGTLSFCDVETGWFAALGHPVSDIDTQSLLTVRDGRLLATEIVDVRKGQEGSPGELIGVFSVYDEPLGRIERNTEYGIFGSLGSMRAEEMGEILPMGYAAEAHEGAAQLIATISSAGPEYFDCEIIRVNAQSGAASKGMVIRVTDQRLLDVTGGIVQGMSGCPVIQDGKLLGIVTHVFVNDPTRGYCIYAEWMREQIMDAQS